MTRRSRIIRSLTVAILMTISIAGARGAWLWACGPYLPETPTIGSTAPLHLEAYQSGDLGVVRPTFARRYLVQAYRVLSGRPPLTDLGIRASTTPIGGPRTDARSAVDAWIEIRDRVLGKDPRSDWEQRDVSRTIDRFYNSIVNCHDDAFVTAARTLEGRIATFGIASVAVREWTQAQAAVFANCSGTELVLPKAPSSTDPLRRADHEYQVAAAYFYATDYPEAANRFRKIALNTASPWQSYGRFLAARATIRSATVPDHPRWRRDELLAEADIELQAVLSDARASTLHESARRLLAFVEVRLHPVKRLAALSHELGAAPITASQDLIDYRYLMDRFVADPLEFMSGSAADVDALMSANDLTNWVLIMQSSDDVSRARALQRWQETRSALWLVPILWQLPLDHSAVPAVLEAASAVARDSPAYPTLAFLRARLLLARGERAEARKLLAILPREPEAGFHAETINLLNAVRLQLAESLDEALATAPRVVIAADDPAAPPSIFDEDGRELFTDRLPLQRLIEASKSAILPNRLRIHVANAALARALVLRRESAAKEAAQSMRELLPRIRIDIERYLSTTTAEERHRAGVLLLLRVPALRAYVPGRHDSASYEGTTRDPRKFDHLFRENWWCVRDSRLASTYGDDPAEIRSLLKLKGRAPYPEFLTSDERAVVEQERAELVAVGSPQGYLAEEAIKWARARPTDLRAAEALALVVEGGRWSCSVPASSRRAFQTLHQLFPTSEWARRTRYWYTGS